MKEAEKVKKRRRLSATPSTQFPVAGFPGPWRTIELFYFVNIELWIRSIE
jgi:hypothetical protein